MAEVNNGGARGPGIDYRIRTLDDELVHLFDFHGVGEVATRDGLTLEEAGKRYGRVRAAGLAMARTIVADAPPGPERDTAIAKVREAVFWGNAGIAVGAR